WLQTSPPSNGKPPAIKPLVVSDLRVMHYRDAGKTLVGDLWTSSAAVRKNDNVRITAKVSTPAYYYLIAFNPQDSEAGVEQLCQPGAETGSGAETARPDLRTEVQSPRNTHDFFLDAVGLQAFVLAASTKPLPPYKEWRTAAGRIPWDGPKDGG